MTAEIAIINRQGIALAADSAVTIGESKVWTHANKLFSLSPYNDIGIMIYGSGSFIGYPWETLIKCYRKKIGQKRFDTVEECASDFINFLKSTEINNREQEAISIFFICLWLVEIIKLELKDVTRSSDEEFEKTIKELITAINSNIQKMPIKFNFNKQDFFSNYKADVIENFKNSIGMLTLSDEICTCFLELCLEISKREISSNSSTGIVIAGFGEKEYFPVLKTYSIDGKYKDIIRAWPDMAKTCNLNNNRQEPVIIPFAQSDMINLFLHGIMDENIDFINFTLKGILAEIPKTIIKKHITDTQKIALIEKEIELIAEKTMNKFAEDFNEFRINTFVTRINNVVYSLPKEEMAAMAEALVELTSLRRKMDSTLQSVGGPTDVAFISKGDGFIWMKRKYYFDAELNHEFFNRKIISQKGAIYE